jgi:hypothetical protein
MAVVHCCDDHRHGLATYKHIKSALSALDRVYSYLLRELPGRTVGVEPADKSNFLVEGPATGPVDRLARPNRRPRDRSPPGLKLRLVDLLPACPPGELTPSSLEKARPSRARC